MAECILSVVIPSYNTDNKLIKRCVDSILSQITNEMEIIIIDDGSKKDYADYLDTIGQLDNRIMIIHQDNKGEGGARNTGINASCGNYLMFVDADDALAPEWIEKSIDLAIKEDADIVAGRIMICNKINETPNHRDSINYRVFKDDCVAKIQEDQLWEHSDIFDSLSYIDIGVCSKLYKKMLFADTRFPEGVVLSVDQIINHKLIKECKVFILTDMLAYYYVNNTNSISHVYHQDAVEVMMLSLDKVKKYLFVNDGVKDAFSYHCIMDLQRALEMSVFNSPERMVFSKKVDSVKEAFKNPLIVEARKSVNPSKIHKLKNKYLCWTIINNHPLAYTIARDIIRMMKKKY